MQNKYSNYIINRIKFKYTYFISLYGEGSTGAEAGLIAGLIFGILDGIFAIITDTIFKSDILKVLTKELASEHINISASSLYSLELDTGFIEAIIGGLIIGLILGIIFAYVHNKIPGKNIIIKGEMFGIILWIIFDLAIGALDISLYGISYYLVVLGLGVIGLIVFGYILGALFNKWSVAEQPVTDSEFNENR